MQSQHLRNCPDRSGHRTVHQTCQKQVRSLALDTSCWLRHTPPQRGRFNFFQHTCRNKRLFYLVQHLLSLKKLLRKPWFLPANLSLSLEPKWTTFPPPPPTTTSCSWMEFQPSSSSSNPMGRQDQNQKWWSSICRVSAGDGWQRPLGFLSRQITANHCKSLSNNFTKCKRNKTRH